MAILTQGNVGRDCSLVIQSFNGLLSIQRYVTDFTAQQMTHSVEWTPLNTSPYFAELPKGWEGSFTIDRYDGTIDNEVSTQEQAFWAQGTRGFWTITQYVVNQDGSTNGYKFVQCAVKLAEAGNFKTEEKVMQRVTFKASVRQVIQ